MSSIRKNSHRVIGDKEGRKRNGNKGAVDGGATGFLFKRSIFSYSVSSFIGGEGRFFPGLRVKALFYFFGFRFVPSKGHFESLLLYWPPVGGNTFVFYKRDSLPTYRGEVRGKGSLFSPYVNNVLLYGFFVQGENQFLVGTPMVTRNPKLLPHKGASVMFRGMVFRLVCRVHEREEGCFHFWSTRGVLSYGSPILTPTFHFCRVRGPIGRCSGKIIVRKLFFIYGSQGPMT